MPGCPKCHGEAGAIVVQTPTGRSMGHIAYCDICKTLWVDDKPFSMAACVADDSLGSIKTQAETMASEIAEDAINSPSKRIEDYFRSVFNWAFAQGFSRAYLHFRKHGKEGRLKRLRRLWSYAEKDSDKLCIRFQTIDQFNEFSEIISWKHH